MLNQETIIKLAVQHGFKVGRDAGGEYVAPKYEDAVGSLVALVQAAYALGKEAQQAEQVAPLRDLIMQAANAVFDETTEAARPAEDGFGVVFGHVDIAAIVDRYAPVQKGGA